MDVAIEATKSRRALGLCIDIIRHALRTVVERRRYTAELHDDALELELLIYRLMAVGLTPKLRRMTKSRYNDHACSLLAIYIYYRFVSCV